MGWGSGFSRPHRLPWVLGKLGHTFPQIGWCLSTPGTQDEGLRELASGHIEHGKTWSRL